MSNYAATTYASTSAVRLGALPPLATLQSWVHRPQAVAACFVSDVYALQNLRESGAGVSRTSRDVFLLNHFPCKLVELVGWVAGVDHKDASMTITLDDGDGAHTLQVVVRLAKVEAPPKTKAVAPAPEPVNTTFLTAKERKAMRKAALAAEAALAAAQTAAAMATFHRPDVRVGDTLRVVGRVDEWARRRHGREEWVRQVFVDEASGSGSLSVVDADEQFRHAAKVASLHETLYSHPFTMPAAPAPVARSPPRATPHSTQSSPAKSTLSSIPSSDVYDDDFAPVAEPRLTDPAKLRSSLLTEATFKRYLMDHVSRETARVLRLSPPPLGHVVPALAALFPEYRHAVLSNTGNDSKRDPFAPSHPRNSNGRQAKQWSLNGSPRCTTPDSDDDVVCLEATPKASKQSTFRSRTERDDALRLNRNNFAPSSAPRPWLDESDDGSDNDAPLGSEQLLLEPFTVDALMNVERLRVLGSKVAEVRARREERLRRQRAKDNASTARDERVVQDRLNRGLRPDHWRLNLHECEHKLRRLTEWALREAAAEGGLVQVQCGLSPSSFFGTDAATQSSWRHELPTTTTTGYLPLPPELVCPLVVPLFEAERAYRLKSTSSMFLPRHDPRRSAGINVECLTKRLRAWGEAGRWERAGEWAVEEALEWGVEQGLFYVCEGGFAVCTGRVSS